MAEELVITVIPNWDLKDDLGVCLESLQKSTYSNHRVVVVDNCSHDGSVEMVRDKFPEVHLITLPENRGYAGGLNAGIDYALQHGARYVFALNNDTVLKPNTLSDLAAVMQADPSIGIATPKILYFACPDLLYGLGDRRFRLIPLPVSYGYRKKDGPRYSGLMDFDYVTGCAMFIRAEALRKVGPWDMSYFMYYEDADFCRRVRASGYRIVCVGSTTILHKAATSTSKVKATSTYQRARNRLWFYRRYRHGPHPWLTYAVIGVVALWRTFLYFARGQSAMIRPYWKGLRAGWRQPLPAPRYTWEASKQP